ncbi:flagellar export protein FliJ [Ferviditalea candida]|uniref:Flagellar FliJ protein n=1 Tax=Ferviditalea candida TaxID=3108399 RepID=A0ABU5ZG40_9BACL|nr:flagellar export protein FliJ [Paenibacillaceae bacterium T2]
MTEFRYALQKIVDLKGNEKTQAEWQLSKAIFRLREEQDSLSRLESEKQKWLNGICAGQSSTVSDLQAVQDYISHLERQILHKHLDVNAANQRVVSSQTLVSDKMKDEKAWSNARERAMQKFTERMLKLEQEAIDELAAMRHGPVISGKG